MIRQLNDNRILDLDSLLVQGRDERFRSVDPYMVNIWIRACPSHCERLE